MVLLATPCLSLTKLGLVTAAATTAYCTRMAMFIKIILNSFAFHDTTAITTFISNYQNISAINCRQQLPEYKYYYLIVDGFEL